MRQPSGAMIAIYHDDPDTTPPIELRSDAGIVVAGARRRCRTGLDEQRIAGGRYARAVHVGPYEELGDAWARFMGEWLPASGHRLGPGASYEIYRNDPTKVAKEDLRTDMYIALA